jgi:hypothetical protein
MMRKFLCWMGLHRWDMPGGVCEDCGKHDDFWNWKEYFKGEGK